ncbi:MAG: protein phosphatase 2C domain-containing protein [Verrucomicrobia bacterium]|nr:protein phosphatase 2C domain-containing protein [Verrucomicrobiota bacterium]
MDFSHLTSAALSDVGRKRKGNEDSILSLPEAGMFCVADGMGGAAGGELASLWTVEAIQHAFKTGASSPRKTALVRDALNEASWRIKAMAEEQGIIGAGTTAVVLFFDDYQPDQATVLHAGDSRAYRIRDGILECLTTDHSLAASVGLPHDSFLPTMFRGVITRAIGLEDTVELDEAVVQVKTGDCFLLCSDGLTKMLSDGDIQNLIHTTSTQDLSRFAATLVDEANRAGGEDNISIILVGFGALPAPIPRPALSNNDADTTNKTETAEIAVPGDSPVPSGSASITGADKESRLPAETEDVFIGATPQTGHGSTASTPTATRPQNERPTPPLSTRLVSIAAEKPAISSGNFRVPTAPAPSRSAGRYLLIFAIVVIALVAVLVFNAARPHQGRSPMTPADQARPAAVVPAAPTTDGILSRVKGAENTAQWTAERNQALQQPSYAAASLNGYLDVVATLCQQAKLPPPPAAPTADQTAKTAEEEADAYCIRLFELQQYLRIQLDTFINDRSAELKIFGASPTAVAESIRRFAGLPARPSAYPFESLQHDLRLITSWLAEDRQRLIPIEEIRSGSPSVLPRMLTQRNALWSAILADIEACGPAIERRQAAASNDILLNNIASLQRVIMKAEQTNRSLNLAVPWPSKENLPTLAGFLERVGRYLDRAPAAEPGEASPE